MGGFYWLGGGRRPLAREQEALEGLGQGEGVQDDEDGDGLHLLVVGPQHEEAVDLGLGEPTLAYLADDHEDFDDDRRQEQPHQREGVRVRLSVQQHEVDQQDERARHDQRQ